MNTFGWIIIGLVAVVLAALASLTIRNRRTGRLRRRFGPEYERVIEETSSRREGERQLTEVAERRDSLTIRPLDAASRSRYCEQWEVVQARFVDEPARAVNDADALITSVLSDRGYPVEDFGERTSLVGVDHPEVVRHYRAARADHLERRDGEEPDTEQQRVEFVHYRELFHALVKDEERSDGHSVDAMDEASPDYPRSIR